VASTGNPTKLVDPRDLLEMLRQHPLTAPFKLTFHSEHDGSQTFLEKVRSVCFPFDATVLCTPECCKRWEENLSQALLASQPVTHCCPQGFVCFSVPLPEGKDLPDVLIGGGVFEIGQPVDQDVRRRISEGAEPPRQISMQEAESVAEEISRVLPRLLEHQVHQLGLTRTTQRLEAVQKLTREIADCENSEQAVAVVSEALVVLFNLPKVLLVLQQPGLAMTIHSTLGLDPKSLQLDQKRLADYFSGFSGHPEALPGELLNSLFPGLETHSAHLFPLGEGGCQHGAVVLLDVNLHDRDQALIELLVNCLATRLGSLKVAEGHRQERLVSERLVTMISDLSLAENRQELYLKILEMSAELLKATSGSLMLLDQTNGTLKIAAAKGMTSSLAKALSVVFGEGIAGRVAKSGMPMLVNDIERDKRVAAQNRPRFKTKSFLSLPLEGKDSMVGVLNLADKSDGAHFTEADLKLVQTFTSRAVPMISRAETLENAGRFEQLAITDPLTGLYNRRFLEERLQQELSRSERQRQTFCLLLADLDNFKIYNDICGHLAGDKALRKMADLMRRTAREMDILTRYGGEEFCLILPGAGKKESVLVGERLRRAIEAESFSGESHLPLGRLTTSIGISSFPTDGLTADELIHTADLALYHAKALGRNRLVLYEPSLDRQPLSSQE
jgi:diguanylate cyclase (GGDEF)-like protein